MSVKRISISQKNKEDLELISGQKLLLKNTFETSGDTIGVLMKQAVSNTEEYLRRKKMGQKLDLYEENNLYKALVDIQKKLEIPNFLHRIECFDISHLQGTHVYGSMVVFIDGRPAKKLYRLFKTTQQNNDYQNLQEVLLRRVKRAYLHKNDAENAWRMPELLVIDGGKGQLTSVVKILREFSQDSEYAEVVSKVAVVALAKQFELIFVPFETQPIQFDGLSKFLLQRIRDETHRFGITQNRKARLLAARKTQLSDIAGIGSITATKLLKEFGSVENIINILYENRPEVIECVGESVTQKLLHHFGIQ